MEELEKGPTNSILGAGDRACYQKQFESVEALIVADAASEPEASEQVSSSNSYWALKARFYFHFSDQNALLLTDQNASLLTNQNALHLRCYKCSCFGVFCIHCMVCLFLAGLTLDILNLLIADNL